jgi:hypothetical protein
MRSLKILIALTLLLILPLTALALEAGIKASYWFTTLDAEIQLNTDSIVGSKVNLKDDLGFDDANFPIVEIFAGIDKHHFSIGLANLDFEGDKTITKTLTFKDETFTASEVVKSELNLLMIDFIYQYDLISLDAVLAGFSLAPTLDLKYLDGSAKIKGLNSGQSTKDDFTGAVPLLGASAHLGILADILEVNGRLVTMGYGGSRVVDGFLELTVTPTPFVDFGVGYRQLLVNIDVDNTVVDLEVTGPFVSLSVNF